jgi:predicted aspartyl protease
MRQAFRMAGSVVLILLVAGCTYLPKYRWHPQETVLATERMELPTVTVKNLLFIEAQINGSGPYRLLADTGAQALVLSEAVAHQAGLRTLRSPRLYHRSPGGWSRARRARIDELVSGGLVLRGVEAIVLDEAQLANLRTSLGYFDGIIGREPFQDVLLEFDFNRRQVSVADPTATDLSAATPLTYEGDVPMVEVQIGGRLERFLLDTGFSEVLAVPDWADLPLRFPPYKSDGVSLFAGVESTRPEWSQLEGDAVMGVATWRDPPLKQGRRKIGTRALHPWRVVLDQRGRRVYLLGDELTMHWESAQPPPLNHRAGIGFVFVGEGWLRLTEIDSGGAADQAGFQVGDLVLAINGHPPAEYLRYPKPAPNEPEPQPGLHFKLRRGDDEFEQWLDVRRYDP